MLSPANCVPCGAEPAAMLSPANGPAAPAEGIAPAIPAGAMPASSAVAAAEAACTAVFASLITCCMSWSTSWPPACRATRLASRFAITTSAHSTVAAIAACMPPITVAMAANPPAACPNCAPTCPTPTKYLTHAAEIASAKTP